jgi:hypothetical protein
MELVVLPLVPGLAPESAVLLDERHRPDFRDVFGALVRRSSDVAVAVTRVRLSTVDLAPAELANLRSLRVLVAEVNALQLDAEATSLLRLPRRAPNVRLLTSMLGEGRLEVRSAPLGGWSPDFTVFIEAGSPLAVLSGFHWFERPYPHRGPALAALHGATAARMARARYQELWDVAHDVGPALWSILARADTRARASG